MLKNDAFHTLNPFFLTKKKAAHHKNEYWKNMFDNSLSRRYPLFYLNIAIMFALMLCFNRLASFLFIPSFLVSFFSHPLSKPVLLFSGIQNTFRTSTKTLSKTKSQERHITNLSLLVAQDKYKYHTSL